MKKLEHIGIAVKDLKTSNDLFTSLLNKEPYKQESVLEQGVNTSFFQLEEVKIELLEAMNEDSPIYKFIQKKGEGIHHLAFEVEDIYKEAERLKQEGFKLLHDQPKEGADNKLIIFLHPQHTNSVLVEICMEKK